MHQAFAKRLIGIAVTVYTAAVDIVIDDGLGHHNIIRNAAFLFGLGLQRLLRSLGGRVPRVVGARTELLLAVRVAARVAVATGSILAPEIRTEASLPQRMVGTVVAVVSLAFSGQNDVVVFWIGLSFIRNR